jgi:hypothetical protein
MTLDPALLAQVQTLRLEPSFGFGDRIGLATPGHVAAMRAAGQGIRPIFPQQSIREMARTGRSAQQVMADALDGMHSAGWTSSTGADADHLKTTADIDVTFAAGYCFFTLDPSDVVDVRADDDSEAALRDKYAALVDKVGWVRDYVGRSVVLSNGKRLEFDEPACLRAAVKYGRAINRALLLAEHLASLHQGSDREYEIELSVDETPHPTTLVEHYIVADQCLRSNMPLVSLAPRFPGDFEKGIDFKGDIEYLRQTSLPDHAAIAQTLGPYKLSLHSGSDKLSIYRYLASATEGRFHVKTAGTSYLEALRVVARHDGALFREIVDFARDRFPVDKASYHVSVNLDELPAARDVPELGQLEEVYLQRWDAVPAGCGFRQPGRQILHCTFGSVLTDAKLGPALRQVLFEHPDAYRQVLEDHFVRHLQALQQGM